MRSTHESDRVCRAPTVGVEERNGMQVNALGFGLKRQTNRESVQIDISVGQHHSLRVGAGATRIEKFGQGVFVETHHIRLVRRCHGQNVFISRG